MVVTLNRLFDIPITKTACQPFPFHSMDFAANRAESLRANLPPWSRFMPRIREPFAVALRHGRFVFHKPYGPTFRPGNSLAKHPSTT